MGCLVKVSGVVTRRSAVFPQLKICKFTCHNCGYILGPYTINGGELARERVRGAGLGQLRSGGWDGAEARLGAFRSRVNWECGP